MTRAPRSSPPRSLAPRSMTPGRLRPVVEILAARLNPRTIQERHADACAKRGVRVTDLPDGIADSDHDGRRGPRPRHPRPAHPGRARGDRRPPRRRRRPRRARRVPTRSTACPTRTAAEPEPARDTRTMDQLRADIFCDLLLTGTAETCTAGEGIDAIHAIMQVTVPVFTAAGVGDEPALLAGYGPIDPDTARRLLGNATGWERVMTSPVTGCVLAVDHYRRTSALTRFLRARDERCRFPGCRQPVWRCDVDHTIDAAHGGPTEPLQPRAPVPTPPRPQTPQRLDRPPTRRRHPGMDQPHRPHLHRPARTRRQVRTTPGTTRLPRPRDVPEVRPRR